MEAPWTADLALEAQYARVAVRLSELEQMPIGPSLVAGMVALRGVPTDCTGGVRLTALWHRVIAWAYAQSMISCADAVLGADLPDFLSRHDAEHIVAQELATMMHVPFATTMDRVALVGQVGRQLPLSWEALDRGELSLEHLKKLANETTACTPRVAQLVDARVVPQAIARGWTPTQLANAAAKAVIAIDPEGAASRAAAAKSCGDVRLYPDRDETASLVATGDAAPLRAAMDAIDIRAAELQRAGDLRPIGLRRLDALAGFILGDQAANRTKVEVVVTVDLTTLLGLTQHPGELSGYGPITADTARELSKDATLRRLVTDPITGIMIDLGRRSYKPSAMLRRIIDARDRTCRFPGCSRRAISCDCDHDNPWGLGGQTETSNLHPLCRRHHNLKTRKLWSVDLNADGTESWTSALGFTYTKPAATYPIELLEPPPVDDMPDVSDPALVPNDPDPPRADDPLPEPPPLSDEEYRAFTDAIERSCYAAANREYDHWRNLGLVS